jgi:ribonuclease P protein component
VVNRRFGNSPARNLFKRRVREAFRTNKDRLPSSHDLLVLPARPGQVPGFEEIAGSLTESATRAARAYVTRGPKPPKTRRS